MTTEATSTETPTDDATAIQEQQEQAALLAAATAADEGKPMPTETPGQNGDASKTDPQPVPKEKEGTAPSATDPASADAGKEQKTDPKPEEKPNAAKTPYQQAKEKEAAERQRLNKSWQELNAQKEALRRERAESDKRKTAQPDNQASNKEAEVYDKLAKDYRAEGDENMAKMAEAKAKEIRAKAAPANQTPTATQPAHETPEFQKEWLAHTQELVAARPELNDAKNPVVQQANALLGDERYRAFFQARPDGIKVAVEIADLMAAAAKAKQLETTLAERDKTIAELNRKLGLGEAPPSGGSKVDGVRITDMSDTDAELTLRKLAEQADGT